MANWLFELDKTVWLKWLFKAKSFEFPS